MRARLIHLVSKLRSSMWFIPAIMATLAAALAFTVSLAEARFPVTPGTERLLFSGDAAGARAILSSIAGSMLGVTGVVFSITIVALTLASGQFGPRLLRNFMRDRVVQTVLGTFIATFVFCMIVLRSIRDTDGVAGAYLAVVIGVTLAIASIGVLIYFIHHIASSIQADTVIARVAAEISERLDHLYPKHIGNPMERGSARELPVSFGALATKITAPRDGYVQALDADVLLNTATRYDLIIEMRLRPGHFAAKKEQLMRAWPASRIDEKVAAELTAAVILGPRRTAEQDLEFLLEQLVEIACRALSPGINDPFTAVACVDRLGAALLALGRRELPTPWREDEAGQLRLVLDVTTYEGLVAASFDQIRQYGRSSVAVTLRLLEMLARMNTACDGDAARQAVVRAQADRVWRSSLLAEHEESDAQVIRERYAIISQSRPNAAPAP